MNKKKIWTGLLLMLLCTLAMGMSVFAAENETIVPTYLKAGESMANANTYQYQFNAGNELLSVPIQVSEAGKVCLEVSNKTEGTTIGVVLSSSSTANDQSGWLDISMPEKQTITVKANATKKCIWYLYVLSVADEDAGKDITISVKAYQQEIPNVKASNVRLSKTSVTWNGKAQKPSIAAKDSNGKTISSSNYTVKYSNNKNVGQATATITFKNDYMGTVKKTFTILPKGTTLSKVTSQKKGFSVKWKKQASQTTGYEIQFSVSNKFKGAKTLKNIGTKVTSKNITKLKAGKRYYVRIRTYKTAKVDGKNKKLYSGWSKEKSVTTKK